MINQRTTWFYFPLIKYEDLCYSEVYRAKNIEWVKDKFNEYENDNYPQGREYCTKLINENLENDECFYIVTRQDGEKWTRYYFKSKCIRINPSNVSLFRGKNELMSELDIIKKSDKNLFPQGIQHCVETFNNQINANGEVYVVNSFEPDSKKMLWYCFLQDEIMYLCDHVGRHKSNFVEIQYVKDRELNPSEVIP